MSKGKIITTAIFVLVIAGLLIIQRQYPTIIFSKNYIPNIVVTLSGILVTVGLVDYLIERDKKEKQKKTVDIVHKKLVPHVARIAELTFQMLKASFEPHQDRTLLPSTYETLFTERYVNQLSRFDMNKGNAPVYPFRSWPIYISTDIKNSLDSIEQVMGAYVAYLEPNTIDLIYNLQNCIFAIILKNIGIITSVWEREGTPITHYPLFGTKQATDFCNKLLRVIEALNDVNHETKIIFDPALYSDNISPKMGQSRMSDAEFKEFEKQLATPLPENKSSQTMVVEGT